MSYDQEIEKMIKDAGADKGMRVTLDGIKAKIDSELYIRTPEGGLTFCKIQLKNGFAFIGHSACVDPQNYNREIGDKIAYDNAFRQIWSHEGYLLKELMHQARLMREAGVAAQSPHLGKQADVDPTDSQAALGQQAHS